MDVLEESSVNSFTQRDTDCKEEIVSYLEQNTSIYDLIQQHQQSDDHISEDEYQEFLCPINEDDDSKVTLASLQAKLSYMRKFKGSYVSFNKFINTNEKQSVDQSAINQRSGVVSATLPTYARSLFYQTLAKPLVYIECMRKTFHALSRLYEKSRTDLRGILESILKTRSPSQLEDWCVCCIEEATAIEGRLSSYMDEFFESCRRCHILGGHFMDVILEDELVECDSFKRERLTCDYLEHKLANLEELANQIISLMYEYLEKKRELFIFKENLLKPTLDQQVKQ